MELAGGGEEVLEGLESCWLVAERRSAVLLSDTFAEVEMVTG